MDKIRNKYKFKDWLSIAKDCFAIAASLAALLVVMTNQGAPFREMWPTLYRLLWGDEQRCRTLLVVITVAQAGLTVAIAGKPVLSRMSNALKITAVLLPLSVLFVVSDLCPKLGIVILAALGCA